MPQNGGLIYSGVIADNASDQLARFCNLFTCLFIRHFVTSTWDRMVPIRCPSSAICFTNSSFPSIFSPIRKKGCLYASFSQTVQQLFRIDRMWSVRRKSGQSQAEYPLMPEVIFHTSGYIPHCRFRFRQTVQTDRCEKACFSSFCIKILSPEFRPFRFFHAILCLPESFYAMFYDLTLPAAMPPFASSLL